jgi:hypothetical protein
LSQEFTLVTNVIKIPNERMSDNMINHVLDV